MQSIHSNFHKIILEKHVTVIYDILTMLHLYIYFNISEIKILTKRKLYIAHFSSLKTESDTLLGVQDRKF